MDAGLGPHGVVLELRLPQRRSVAGNDDELGLSSSETDILVRNYGFKKPKGYAYDLRVLL